MKEDKEERKSKQIQTTSYSTAKPSNSARLSINDPDSATSPKAKSDDPQVIYIMSDEDLLEIAQHFHNKSKQHGDQ